jgi:Acyl-CoA dehydrogenase, C-terminal domain
MAVIGSRAAGPTAAALGTANGCSAAAWCMMGRTRAVCQAAARRRGSCASRNRRSSHRYLARRRSTRHWQPRLRDRQRVRAGQPDDAGVRSHGRAAGDALSHADCQSVSVGPSRSDAPRRACRDRGVRRTSGDESTSGLADGAARQVVAQSAVGRADALLPAARSGFADAIEMQLREVAAGRTPSLAGRAGVRSATAFAGEASLRAIELVYNAAGGGAILASGRLDRDVRVAVQRIGLSTNAYEPAGRVLPGLEPGLPRFFASGVLPPTRRFGRAGKGISRSGGRPGPGLRAHRADRHLHQIDEHHAQSGLTTAPG